MKKFGNELKRHALTAISYMLPLVVASGLLIAIGNLMGGQVIEDYSQSFTIASSLTSLGVMGMGLLSPFIAGYIAYSIAERPGIAPGFLMGLIANSLGAGFLGGMIGGYLVGYFILWMKNTIKVPKWAEGLMPMMIIPTISSIVVGLIMFFVIGGPISWLTIQLTNYLQSLDESSRVVYGFIFGILGALDYGGPISKVPNLMADGLLLEGVLEPEAIKVVGAMVPPVGVTFAWVLSKIFKKPIFTRREEDAIKVAFPMGLTMITEGVIPIAMNDLLRTVFATAMGTGVAGAINFYFQNGSPVPSGGVFVIPAMTKPMIAITALIIGSLVTGLILVLIKKKITVEEYDSLEIKDEEEMDLSGFSIE
ncbi:PTS fructose transporter subunit IIC [Facklamia sp. DSM 111018]|uniref:PTS fructose transporter subunit IIC n=1 Tax=Facklamia lactis TaxID=2749967 RepID=A0ABS0LQD1_9LACT|nr:PTS fructose transporter subunit IIC [Facklamia lactis]MBG9986358.1 PTS fructose transporter subunit IIC [Facklamia lactis]